MEMETGYLMPAEKDIKAGKSMLSTGTSKAKEWRNAIAEVINTVNEKQGIMERIDPRSYKDRGIPLIPTIHLGEKASALERKGIQTERGNINRAIEKYNAMIMKIYGLVMEIKEELKKVFSNLLLKEKAGQKRKVIYLSIHPYQNRNQRF